MSLVSRRLILALAAAGATSALGRSVAIAQTPQKITVAESEGHGWTVVYVADAVNTWRAAGLEATVAKFTAGRLAQEALLAEKAEFCTTTPSTVLLAAMRGLKPRIVADFSRSSRELVVAANVSTGVRTPGDLKGKKIATRIGSSSHFFTNQFLKLHGLSMSEVEIVNMSGPEMVTAVVRGDVAAFAWDWKSAAEARAQGGDKIVVLPQAGIEKIWRYHLVLVTNEKTITGRPEVLEPAVRALLAAEEFIGKNRREAIKHVAERTATSEKDTEVGIELLDIGVKLDGSMLDAMVTEATWAIESGIAKAPGADLRALFRSTIHDGPLRKVRPDRVTL